MMDLMENLPARAIERAKAGKTAKLANNTYLETRDKDGLAVRLHKTEQATKVMWSAFCGWPVVTCGRIPMTTERGYFTPKYTVQPGDVGKSAHTRNRGWKPQLEPLGIVQAGDVGKICKKIGGLWYVENDEQFRIRLAKGGPT